MTPKSGRGNQTVTLEVPEELIKSAELYSELTGIDKGDCAFSMAANWRRKRNVAVGKRW